MAGDELHHPFTESFLNRPQLNCFSRGLYCVPRSPFRRWDISNELYDPRVKGR
jgi:hypothetical protein